MTSERDCEYTAHTYDDGNGNGTRVKRGKEIL